MANCPQCGFPLDTANHGYEVQFAALADAVNLSREGKLNITGEFDIIWSQQEPVGWVLMYFVAKIKVGEAAGPEIQIGLSILDEDGNLVVPAVAITGPKPESKIVGQPASFPLVVPIYNAQFPKFGTYLFQLSGGGVPLVAIPIHILQAPASA